MMALVLATTLNISSLTDAQVCRMAGELSSRNPRTMTEDDVNLEHNLWVEIDVRDILALCQELWGNSH